MWGVVMCVPLWVVLPRCHSNSSSGCDTPSFIYLVTHIAATSNSLCTRPHTGKQVACPGNILPLLCFFCFTNFFFLCHFPLTKLVCFPCLFRHFQVEVIWIVTFAKLHSWLLSFYCLFTVCSVCFITVVTSIHSEIGSGITAGCVFYYYYLFILDEAVSGAVWADAEGKHTLKSKRTKQKNPFRRVYV